MKYLKMRGFKIGLASSTREVLVRSEISDGGLLGYFDQIIGGDMVERSKPEPDIFSGGLQRLESKPENCYVIEDSYNGIRAAHAAGMHPYYGAGSDGTDGGDEGVGRENIEVVV